MTTPPNDCAHLVQGPDAEVYNAADFARLKDVTNWWCVWGETVDTKSMPPWVSSHIDAGGPNFVPKNHCPNCPAYAPLTCPSSKGSPNEHD